MLYLLLVAECKRSLRVTPLLFKNNYNEFLFGGDSSGNLDLQITVTAANYLLKITNPSLSAAHESARRKGLFRLRCLGIGISQYSPNARSETATNYGNILYALLGYCRICHVALIALARSSNELHR